MDEKNKNNEMNEYFINKTLLNMYKKGYSMKSIVKKFYKFKNKNSKPININGVWCFPPKIYDMKFCNLYVYELIYKYLAEDCGTSFSA